MPTNTFHIGMAGLGVMGSNLALNFAEHGYSVVAYDRDGDLREQFAKGAARGRKIEVLANASAFCEALPAPRRIMIMVKAGAPVDWVIEQLLPHLSKGDIVIDGGNSYFKDTIRRSKRLEDQGVHFIGAGVSGGASGARHGPSLMPGGSKEAWEHVREPLQAIAARDHEGLPCCEYLGPDGAGHYVKMVHNGIEYGDMQLICEAYWLMRQVLGIAPQEQAEIFGEWNKGELRSYLIEITGRILERTDPETSQPMVDVILDTAGQKGTGKWTSSEGLDLGAPIPTIAEAVFARCISAVKEEREAAAAALNGPQTTFAAGRDAFVEDIRQALFASKICSYAQGFQLLRYAAHEYQWDLNYATIARLWRAGCIIRADFLDRVKASFDKEPNSINLVVMPYFSEAIDKAQTSWRRVVATGAEYGAPVPAMSSALAYYDSYRSAVLPANLLQAQRDYFGAHTYERVDKPRGEFFHTEWQ